jgi:peptidyl-prolyl cis-trans isomerase C
VVGRYDGAKITAEELRREASRMPPVLRKQFDTANGRRELVGAMIDKRLLVREAERRGLDDDPELRRQVRDLEERLLVQALVGEEERRAEAPGEAELRAWYEAHRAELAQPERVRLSRILVSQGARGAAPERARARARAEQLAARVRRGEPFGKVAREGDGPERAKEGDLGLVARGGTKDERLEAAAFALTRPGETSGVVECADGFAVLRLEERRPARVPTFEEARGEVENRMSPERKRKAFDGLLARLRRDAEVAIEVAPGPR